MCNNVCLCVNNNEFNTSFYITLVTSFSLMCLVKIISALFLYLNEKTHCRIKIMVVFVHAIVPVFQQVTLTC